MEIIAAFTPSSSHHIPRGGMLLYHTIPQVLAAIRDKAFVNNEECFGMSNTKISGAFAAVCLVAFYGLAWTQTPASQSLTQEEALAFIKGKTYTSTRAQGGNPRLQFEDNGRMYGTNQGSSDSGTWEVKDGKLCMKWRRWEYEGCGQLVRGADSKVRHMYPDPYNQSVHVTFD